MFVDHNEFKLETKSNTISRKPPNIWKFNNTNLNNLYIKENGKGNWKILRITTYQNVWDTTKVKGFMLAKYNVKGLYISKKKGSKSITYVPS